MNVIISAFALVIGIIFMTISTIAGLIFIPITLLWSVLFGKPVRDYESFESSLDVPLRTRDNDLNITIDYVPPMYYEAYSEYLRSQEWRDFRKLVLKRDKYRCVDCGVPAYHKQFCTHGEKLQVHHIHYDGIETMTFTTDQCVSVCKTCHDRRHGR